MHGAGGGGLEELESAMWKRSSFLPSFWGLKGRLLPSGWKKGIPGVWRGGQKPGFAANPPISSETEAVAAQTVQ